jgi:broad specificity phosphatase PhoE
MLRRMRFTLVRHAQPEWVRDGRNIDDPPLTEVGRAQAEHLGRRFRGERIDTLLVSTLLRARQTAEPIADALGVEPELCPWLEEMRNPEFEGTPAQYVQDLFRTQRGKSPEELWDGLPGGESFHDFHRRVTQGVQAFLEKAGSERIRDEPAQWQLADPGHHVVIVAHAGTDAVAIGYLLGIPPVPWEWERFVKFHASVSTVDPIDISGCHAYSLTMLSDVAHLPPGLHTR